MSFTHKIKRAIRDPKALLAYVKNRGWRHRNFVWEEGSDGLKRKKYKNYQEYLVHQKSKLDKINATWLPEQDAKYYEVLRERLSQDQLSPGSNVLCLAARTGVEVKAFIDSGFFALGIDLNPGKENKYVVVGDFHYLQFADRSVDVVYTNSLDHALDIDAIAKEVSRVLVSGGTLILEIMKGEDAGVLPRYYEAASWKSTDVVLGFFTRAGFRVQSRTDFEYPWKGEHVVLQSPTSRD